MPTPTVALRVIGARGRVSCLSHPLDRREAGVPSGGDLQHPSLGLSKPLVAYGEARLAADALCPDEVGAFQDEEVLGDALSGNRELGGEPACRRFAVLEQEF